MQGLHCIQKLLVCSDSMTSASASQVLGALAQYHNRFGWWLQQQPQLLWMDKYHTNTEKPESRDIVMPLFCYVSRGKVFICRAAFSLMKEERGTENFCGLCIG